MSEFKNQRHVLFVCSKNQWRSPTAEAIFRKDNRLSVRSAGTGQGARRKISAKDIIWADIILVMEEKHKARIQADFRQSIMRTQIYVLDIPDIYQFMDAELIDVLKEACEPLIWG